jgi:hypothetical protein
MINPYERDESPMDCSGCAGTPHTSELISGQRVLVCSACLHDSTFVCPDCPVHEHRHWIADGIRVYVSPTIYCGEHAKEKQDAAEQWWEQRQNEYKDEMNQERR